MTSEETHCIVDVATDLNFSLHTKLWKLPSKSSSSLYALLMLRCNYSLVMLHFGLERNFMGEMQHASKSKENFPVWLQREYVRPFLNSTGKRTYMCSPSQHDHSIPLISKQLNIGFVLQGV